MAEAKKRGVRKTRIGTVISKSGAKSVVVQVESRYPHPMYKKVLTRRTKCHAHDESNEAKKGDRVKIVETKPVSKLKKWRVVEVIRKKSEAA